MNEPTWTNHLNYVDQKGRLYCRKEHAVIQADFHGCFDCAYLYGSLQGEGVECAWNDATDEYIAYVHDPELEYRRVSKLVDSHILERG